LEKVKGVIVAKQNNLVSVKVLVSNAHIHLELFESSYGANLFLSSTVRNPKGIVYYAVTPSLFCAFLENFISLQTMFNASPSIFVEISNDGKTTLYSRSDIDITLKMGEKKIKQLIDHCPIEVW
jgi:hypothetical protein